MNELMLLSVFSKNQFRLAEEHYKKSNLKEAIETVSSLVMNYPNTSENHLKMSQVLVAYQIHWRIRNRFNHYGILGISRALCSHQMIQRNYMKLRDNLCPEENVSVAAKSAFTIINTSWRVLSDPESRKVYNIEKGFARRIVHRPPLQPVREEKNDFVDITIFDSDSD